MINIKYKNDLITIDKRLSQVRYCENIKEHGYIHFLNFPDYKYYEYGFQHIDQDVKYFLKCVRWFISWELNKNLTLKKMELLK